MRPPPSADQYPSPLRIASRADIDGLAVLAGPAETAFALVSAADGAPPSLHRLSLGSTAVGMPLVPVPSASGPLPATSPVLVDLGGGLVGLSHCDADGWRQSSRRAR